MAETKKTRPAFVYLVRCTDGTLYCGSCYDIAARIAKHDDGTGARYTRGRGPVVLCYLEELANWGAALSRERAIKKLTRPQKDRLIADWRPGDSHGATLVTSPRPPTTAGRPRGEQKARRR